MNARQVKLARWMAGVLVTALAATAAWGAVAKVDGLVVDQESRPIRNAVVTIRAADGAEVTAETNRRGKFSATIKEMTSGYTIRVEAQGYATYEGPIELRENQTLEVTIPLLTQEVAEKQRAEIAAIEARNKAARLYNEGAGKYNEGDLDAAIALFQEAVAEEDELLAAWGGLGRVYLEQEKYAEAAEALERYDQLEPGQEPALLMLHDSYRGMGADDKADELLARLRAEFPGSGTAARIFNQGVEAIKRQDLATARERFETVVAMAPEIYQANINLAHIHRALGDWEKTLEQVDVFLGHEASHPRALALRYEALNALQRDEQAQQALDKLREAGPAEAAQIFHEQGVDLFNLGEVDAALRSFQIALDIYPDHPRAHYRAGLCYLSQADNAKAREHLERFVELAPDDPEATTAREMLSYL